MQSSMIPTQKGFRSPNWPLLAPLVVIPHQYIQILRCSHHFSRKTGQKHPKSNYTSYFGITSAYPKQLNALEGSITNDIKQGEMAYITVPNIAGRTFQKPGWITFFLPVPTYVPRGLIHHAGLCAAPTYAPRRKSHQHNFGHSFSWPPPCTKVHQISLSKPT